MPVNFEAIGGARSLALLEDPRSLLELPEMNQLLKEVRSLVACGRCSISASFESIAGYLQMGLFCGSTLVSKLDIVQSAGFETLFFNLRVCQS